MSISEHKHVSKAEGSAQRIEIFTGAGRRRSWSSDEKAAIVAESCESGVKVCHVARRGAASNAGLVRRPQSWHRAGSESWALLWSGAALVALPIASQLIVAAPLYLWRSRYGELSPTDKYWRVNWALARASK
jgi:Transposase